MTPSPGIAPEESRSSHRCFLLPHEDTAAFESLSAAFTAEYRPSGPTESFLLQELVRCEWKLRRVTFMEAGLLSSAASEAALAALFTSGDQVLKLERYAAGVRRDFYRALKELRTLQRENAREKYQQSAATLDRFLEYALGSPAPNPPSEPPAAPQPPAPAVPDNSKPMPVHLERELAAHKRRDPLFDPAMDASQMTKELRRWFEKNGRPASAPVRAIQSQSQTGTMPA